VAASAASAAAATAAAAAAQLSPTPESIALESNHGENKSSDFA